MAILFSAVGMTFVLRKDCWSFTISVAFDGSTVSWRVLSSLAMCKRARDNIDFLSTFKVLVASQKTSRNTITCIKKIFLARASIIEQFHSSKSASVSATWSNTDISIECFVSLCQKFLADGMVEAASFKNFVSKLTFFNVIVSIAAVNVSSADAGICEPGGFRTVDIVS